jgi:fibronectin-binding autotransporter adhesin
MNGGTLQAGGSFTLDNAGSNLRPIALLGGGGSINTNGFNVTVDGVISTAFANQDGPLTKLGAGTLTLSGANSYAGATIISGGVLSVSSLANGGSNSGIGASLGLAPALVLDGGTLQYTGAGSSTNRTFTLDQNGGGLDASGAGALNYTSTLADAFTGSGNRTLTLTGASTASNTLASSIMDASTFGAGGSGTTAIAKTGVGTWVLTGLNTYTGGTTISGGILQEGAADIGTLGSLSADALGSASGSLTVTSGSLDMNSNNTTVGALSGGSGGYVTSSSGNATLTVAPGAGVSSTFAGTIQNGASGAVGFTQAGTGATLLTGASTYTGATSVTSGTLALSSGGSLGNTAITVSSGATLSAAVSGNGNFNVGTTGATLTLSGGSLLAMQAADSDTLDTLTLNSTGAATGTVLSVGGANSFATLTFDLSSTGADQLVVNDGKTAFNTDGGKILISDLDIGQNGNNPAGVYTLIVDPNGGLAVNASQGAEGNDFWLGTPGLTLSSGSTYQLSLVSLSGTAVVLDVTPTSANFYWTGMGPGLATSGSSSWSNISNFATDQTGAVAQTGSLTQVSNVFLTATSAAHFSQTLDGIYSINSLSFTGTGTSAATNPITLASGTLTIEAANSFIDQNGTIYTTGTGLVVQPGSAGGTVSARALAGKS